MTPSGFPQASGRFNFTPVPLHTASDPVAVFTRCLVCQTTFPANESLEYFPLADRVAFDPARGRLWAVCRSCKRWSLAPIEERWEALEELEKVVTDRARLLSGTENVALLRAGPLEIVRVGGARMEEEAWWRYGRELTDRRRNVKKISFVGSVAVGAAIFGGLATSGIGLVGSWFLWDAAPDKVTHGVRWFRYGSTAWRGDETCPRCGHRFRSLSFRDRSRYLLVPGGEPGSAPALSVRCPRCRGHRDGGLHLSGRPAERTVRRLLAYHHYSGASERRVRSATRLIREAGSPHDLSRLVLREGRPLGDLRRTGAIALEIAANDAVEQRLLEMELAELEARWREEEELASIVDGELTPLPLLEGLRLKVRGRS